MQLLYKSYFIRFNVCNVRSFGSKWWFYPSKRTLLIKVFTVRIITNESKNIELHLNITLLDCKISKEGNVMQRGICHQIDTFIFGNVSKIRWNYHLTRDDIDTKCTKYKETIIFERITTVKQLLRWKKKRNIFRLSMIHRCAISRSHETRNRISVSIVLRCTGIYRFPKTYNVLPAST